jgi:hypothetical protein
LSALLIVPEFGFGYFFLDEIEFRFLGLRVKGTSAVRILSMTALRIFLSVLRSWFHSSSRFGMQAAMRIDALNAAHNHTNTSP